MITFSCETLVKLRAIQGAEMPCIELGNPVLTRCLDGGSRGTRTPGLLFVRQVL
jgi:hypothetical protein